MDTLSHILLGAAIGEAVLGKKIGKKAMVWGALANNLPDIDVFLTPFFHPVDALLVHRGATHSFLFVLLTAPLLAWVFSRFFKNTTTLGDWAKLFFIGILAHPLLDSCTMYGTALLEPFSHYRAQFTALFILEPLYTLPLLAGVVALIILKRSSPERIFWTKFGLYLSTGYLLLAICNKLYIGKVFTDSLKEQGLHFTEYMTTPTPFNNILWNVVAKDTGGFWIGYYSHFDKNKRVQFSFIPRNDSLAGHLIEKEAVQKLIRFSNGYYCFTRRDGMLYVNDLRFAFAGEFSPRARDFVFSFGIKADSNAPYGVKIERNSWSNSRFMGFAKLVERIKGN